MSIYTITGLKTKVNEYLQGNYVKLNEKILEDLLEIYQEPPFYFKIKNIYSNEFYYVGVIEFTSDKNVIELPCHLYNNLNEKIKLELVKNIPKGEFIKFKVTPESFLELKSYDKLLQVKLSNYCLINKTPIKINFFDEEYIFELVEIKKLSEENKGELENTECVDIVNVDLKVDFVRTPCSETLVRPKENSKLSSCKTEANRLSKEELRMKRLLYFSN